MREEYENLCIMLKLKHIIESKLNEKGLHDTSRLEFDCISSVVELEASGIQFDIKKYSSLIGDIESKVSSLEKQIAGLLGRVNIAADGEVIEVLKSYKGLEEIKTIGDLTLLPQDEYPVVKVYLQYMNLKHLLQKYNLDFLKNISKNDGRVYASYSQVGSSTGRIYCANPNLQQIPRMGEFRECFIPREGCKLIRADYSQIELRIAAEISEDAVMIDAFKRGQDIHRFTASVIKNKVYDEVTDEERQAAKPINFGLIYGMGERGLIEYAWNAFGVRLSLEEAVKFNNLFFKKFTGIARWQVSIYRHSHNESRTIGGRLRVWEKIPSITELYNTPVQGTGADILKRALSKLYDRLKGLNTSIVLIVHDEILLEAPGTIAQGVKDILLQCMVEAGKEYLRKVPVKVEAVIGNSWADRQNQIC
jgi:DNA polymerase I-like protein with 3'-5' exonuclease and polymerase domains